VLGKRKEGAETEGKNGLRREGETLTKSGEKRGVCYPKGKENRNPPPPRGSDAGVLFLKKSFFGGKRRVHIHYVSWGNEKKGLI